MFYLNEDVYVYLDETFGEYTCYYTGRIGMNTKEALLLESSSCNITANRLCILTEEQIRDNKEYLYFIKHLTKEQLIKYIELQGKSIKINNMNGNFETFCRINGITYIKNYSTTRIMKLANKLSLLGLM